MVEEKRENQLEVIVKQYDLEEAKAKTMLTQFSGYFDMAAEWETKAKAIQVTDESQTGDMAMAREGRLFLREKRLAVENTRKKLKEQSLREGRAIDGIANVLKALIVPIEDHLKEQEDFVKIKREREEAIRREEAERALREKEQREAEEREAAERERQAKMAAELERLREEQEKQEKQLEAERKKREASEKKRKAEQERMKRKLEEQYKAAEAKRKEEQAVMQKKLEAERKETEKRIAEARAEAEAKAAQVKCPKCGEVFDGREHKAESDG